MTELSSVPSMQLTLSKEGGIVMLGDMTVNVSLDGHVIVHADPEARIFFNGALPAGELQQRGFSGDDKTVHLPMFGVRLEMGPDGLIVSSPHALQVKPALPKGKIIQAGLQAGDMVAGGSVYMGLSPDSGEPLYVTPADEIKPPLWGEFNRTAAKNMADGTAVYGYKTWRPPTPAELRMVAETLKGLPPLKASFSQRAYWTSADCGDAKKDYAIQINIEDGAQKLAAKIEHAGARYFRTGPLLSKV